MDDKIESVKADLQKLSLEDLHQIYGWLQDFLQPISTDELALPKNKITGQKIKERSQDFMTYRQEYVRCGKEGCKCADGEPHGPYWYSYWNENGKTKSRYIGKDLPNAQI